MARDGTDLNNAYELRSRRPLNNTEVIKMRSAPAGVIDQALRPVIRELLLQDNPQRNTRSKTLAREMRATLPSDRAFIRKVMDMFQNDGFVYTLEPPALGTNSVDEFLFDSRRGFCAHYASAFATLMRAADIPARVVLGYQGGELNPLIGQWQVRQSNAHAWNEVWLADAGWVRMDPTAAVSAARIAEGLDAALAETGERRSLFDWNMALAERIQLGWDALNARWDEWVLGYGPTTQKAFLSWLGLTKPSWRSITIVLVVATALILALVALLMRRSYRKRRSDPPETLYRGALQGLNIQAAPFATPGSVYELICNRYPHAANAAKKMVASYQALRYANQGSLDELRRTINDLQHVIRQEPATAATRPTQTTASK